MYMYVVLQFWHNTIVVQKCKLKLKEKIIKKSFIEKIVYKSSKKLMFKTTSHKQNNKQWWVAIELKTRHREEIVLSLKSVCMKNFLWHVN